MGSLFQAIFKFCSTNRIFNYFKRRYNSGEVKELNNLVKLKGKLRTQLITYRFLNQCLINRVVPAHIQSRISKSKVRQSSTIEQAFLRDAPSQALETYSTLRRTYRTCWRKVYTFIYFSDILRLCRYLGDLDDKTFLSAQKRNDITINRLIKKRFGLSGIPDDKVITNLSDRLCAQPNGEICS